MSQENVEKIRRGIDAWNRGDRAEALAYYAPEAEWHTSGEFADQGVYRGTQGSSGSGRNSRRTWRS